MKPTDKEASPLVGWKGRRWVLAGLALVLAVAASLAVLPAFFSNRTRIITEPLDQVVPAAVDGWTVKTLPVADSPEMRSAVVKILRYDDVIYRAYRRGATEVQIYAAYWKPGSVPYGQAGVHTPDTCWVSDGWTMHDRVDDTARACGGNWLKPGEWRRFTFQGQTLYVVFWHLVGGRVHTYDQYGWRNGPLGYLQRLPHLFKDIRQFGFNLDEEQIFVRVSANRPFDLLLGDPNFAELMRHLAPLGVFEVSKEPQA